MLTTKPTPGGWGPVSISHKTSCYKISQSLEAAKFVFLELSDRSEFVWCITADLPGKFQSDTSILTPDLTPSRLCEISRYLIGYWNGALVWVVMCEFKASAQWHHIASQITSHATVCSAYCSGWQQMKYQSLTLLTLLCEGAPVTNYAELWCLLWCELDKLLKKQFYCQWFERTSCSSDFTLMTAR